MAFKITLRIKLRMTFKTGDFKGYPSENLKRRCVLYRDLEGA